MASAKQPSKWANVKLRRPLVRWLKIEAARREKFMMVLVEELITEALGGAPWQK